MEVISHLGYLRRETLENLVLTESIRLITIFRLINNTHMDWGSLIRMVRIIYWRLMKDLLCKNMMKNQFTPKKESLMISNQIIGCIKYSRHPQTTFIKEINSPTKNSLLPLGIRTHLKVIHWRLLIYKMNIRWGIYKTREVAMRTRVMGLLKAKTASMRSHLFSRVYTRRTENNKKNNSTWLIALEGRDQIPDKNSKKNFHHYSQMRQF